MNPEQQTLIDALKDVRSPFTYLFFATVVGALVRLLKGKTASQLLDAVPVSWVKRIPAKYLPWTAVGLAGVVMFLDAKLNAGLGLSQSFGLAIMGAVLSGGTAIGGHETVAKVVGTIFPQVATPPTEVCVPVETVTKAKPEEKKSDTPPGMTLIVVGLLVAFAFGGAGEAITAAMTPSPTITVAMTPSPIAAAGCTPAARRAIADATLAASQIACIASSSLIDESAIAKACDIVNTPALRDLIRNLVSQREAAKRSGFVWPGADAGAPVDAGAR